MGSNIMHVFGDHEQGGQTLESADAMPRILKKEGRGGGLANSLHPKQPVGLWPFPIANLLLPSIDEQDPKFSNADTVVEGWLTGHLETISCDEVPRRWKFYNVALAGDLVQATMLLDQDDADDPVVQLNRFAMSPTQDGYAILSSRFHGAYRQWLDTIAFTAGWIDRVPEVDSLAGPLKSVGHAARAADAIGRGEHARAAEELAHGVAACQQSSPGLMAMLTMQRVELVPALRGASAVGMVQELRMAIDAIQGSGWEVLQAELNMKLGMVLQEIAGSDRRALLDAIHAYQKALQQGVEDASHPEWFATLHNNLALAYMAMPMAETSAQLRVGVAMQSLRHALRIYTKQSNPDMWASVSMNLASALQYAPSSHPQENLIQAVEIYEEVLEVRSRAKDPAAYALVLLNQANALAHLGIFKPALEKLAEAHKLFQWYDCPDLATAARELVEQINHRIAERQEMAGVV